MKTDYKVEPVRDIYELETVSDRIEYIRCTLGYPISHFARKIGGNLMSVKNIVGKKYASPRLSVLQTIAEVFPVSLEWLVIGTGNAFSEKLKDHYYNEAMGINLSGKQIVVDINARIKQIREDQNMSQAIMANILRNTRDVISSIENNRQNPTSILYQNLAKMLKINLHWLITGEGKMYINK